MLPGPENLKKRNHTFPVFFNFVCICVGYIHTSAGNPQSIEEAIRLPNVEVPGGYETPNVGP